MLIAENNFIIVSNECKCIISSSYHRWIKIENMLFLCFFFRCLHKIFTCTFTDDSRIQRVENCARCDRTDHGAYLQIRYCEALFYPEVLLKAVIFVSWCYTRDELGLLFFLLNLPPTSRPPFYLFIFIIIIYFIEALLWESLPCSESTWQRLDMHSHHKHSSCMGSRSTWGAHVPYGKQTLRLPGKHTVSRLSRCCS